MTKTEKKRGRPPKTQEVESKKPDVSEALKNLQDAKRIYDSLLRDYISASRKAEKDIRRLEKALLKTADEAASKKRRRGRPPKTQR